MIKMSIRNAKTKTSQPIQKQSNKFWFWRTQLTTNSRIIIQNFVYQVITIFMQDFMVYLKNTKQTFLFRPIVSACGTSTYKLAKFLTKLLHQYCGNNVSFIMDSKDPVHSLKEQTVAPNEILVCFDVSQLFTSLPVSVVVEEINREFTEHIEEVWTIS